MALETGTYISDLVATNPTGSDPLAFADDHLRLLKSTIKTTFPNISGAVTKTHTEINTAVDQAGTAVQPSVMDAAIAAAKQALYPVGSIYINAGVTTNPATLLGFGTWTAFGAGRVMVGLNGSDPLFDALEEAGGSKDAIVVSHSHTGTTDGAGSHNHAVQIQYKPNGLGGGPHAMLDGNQPITGYETKTTSDAGAHSHSFTTNSTGSSGTNANLQPYITVAMWKRTA